MKNICPHTAEIIRKMYTVSVHQFLLLNYLMSLSVSIIMYPGGNCRVTDEQIPAGAHFSLN